MNIILVILGYLKWHYGKAVRSLGSVWKNFLYFILDFFSIQLLFENFFDPWKKMTDPYPSLIEFKEFFYILVTNIITRIIGIIMRTILLLIGLVCYIIFAILYPLALIIWLALPIIITVMIISSLYLIFK